MQPLFSKLLVKFSCSFTFSVTFSQLWVGTVVRALTFHQCNVGSIYWPTVIFGLCLLVFYSALRGFSPGNLVFPSHQKPTFHLLWFSLICPPISKACVPSYKKWHLLPLLLFKRQNNGTPCLRFLTLSVQNTGENFVPYLKVTNNIQLSPEKEVNSGGYIPRREASRYISTALHRPWGG